MRSTLGISQKHSRNTSGAHAIRCCSVPRFSCAKAEDPTNSRVAIASGCHAPTRRISGNLASFESTSTIGALPSCPIEPPRRQGYTGLWRTDGFGATAAFRPNLRIDATTPDFKGGVESLLQVLERAWATPCGSRQHALPSV